MGGGGAKGCHGQHWGGGGLQAGSGEAWEAACVLASMSETRGGRGDRQDWEVVGGRHWHTRSHRGRAATPAPRGRLPAPPQPTGGHAAGHEDGGGRLRPHVEAREAQVVRRAAVGALRQHGCRLLEGANVAELRLGPVGRRAQTWARWQGGCLGRAVVHRARCARRRRQPRPPPPRAARLWLGSSSASRSASLTRFSSSSLRASRSAMCARLMSGQCSGTPSCAAARRRAPARWGASGLAADARRLAAKSAHPCGPTFQCRLSVQKSQMCMPQVQHCLVAGRRHTSQVTTSCAARRAGGSVATWPAAATLPPHQPPPNPLPQRCLHAAAECHMLAFV